MKANKDGFGNIDIESTEVENFPEIENGIKQTLARLLGFDAPNKIFRLLKTDSNGYLFVSTSASTSGNATNAAAVIGVVSSIIVAANPSRKYVAIQNLGANAIYLGLGAAAVVASGLQIPSNGIWIEDRYLGVINGISAIAGNDVRVQEVS